MLIVNFFMTVLYTVKVAFGALLECESTPHCFCPDKTELTYLCPFDYAENGGFQIVVTKRKEVVIDCENLQNYDTLPAIPLSKINLLHLRFCPLPENGFAKILQNLNIEESLVIDFEFGTTHTNLDKNYFEKLEKLHFLKLSKNGFTTLDDNVFESTPNLYALELRGNKLSDLKPKIFEKTPLLEWLDLADNQLETIPFGLFQKLTKLEFLRLWNNKLTILDNSMFLGLTNLKSLELTANRIDTISVNAFQNLKKLTNLSLAINNLTLVPANVLKNNPKLQVLSLKDNPNLTSVEFLSNLTLLQEIDLSNCGLPEIPETIFENSPELKVVLLRENRLKKLPKNGFRQLFHLEELDLSYNKIESIEHVFSSLRKLRVLHLQNNEIRTIEKETFVDLIQLEELNLESNQITTIHPKAFFNNDQLRIINFAHNQYHQTEEILLKHVTNIEEVNLSHNLITKIEEVITIDNKPQLEVLDLSYNLIAEAHISDLQGVSNLDIHLDHNQIKIVRFDNFELLSSPYTSRIHLEDNPLSCDCQNYDLVKYLQSKSDIFDIKIDNFDCGAIQVPTDLVPLTSLVCPLNTGCPKYCSCSWKPLDNSIIINCANKNLTKVPPIVPSAFSSIGFSQIEVHLENNSVVQANLTGFDNVTKLYLSNNKLIELTVVPPNIQVLHLDHNQLTNLSLEVLRCLNATNFVNLTLDNNPWNCNCGTKNLTNFIRQHSKKIESKYVNCVNSTTQLINLTETDLCQLQNLTLLFAVFVVLLVLIITLTILYYKYKKFLKFWLYSKNLCLQFVSEQDLDDDKTYDAFISFSHKDEAFVNSILVPGLESSTKKYNLCIHYRDFVPGELISTQIISSIESSKRTIVVLSRNFVKSEWGKAEFLYAHGLGMKEGRVRVVVVLLEELNLDELGEEMRIYLKSSTYVKWGDEYFWEKLTYALPHRKLKV